MYKQEYSDLILVNNFFLTNYKLHESRSFCLTSHRFVSCYKPRITMTSTHSRCSVNGSHLGVCPQVYAGTGPW